MRIDVDGLAMFFDVEGTELTVAEDGMRTRQQLVLVHGAEVDHSFFRPRLSTLAQFVQLLYVDLPGHGRSDPGQSGDWGRDAFADRLHQFCRALEIRRPIALGSSMGGRVAMAWAARHPDDLAALVLVNATATSERERTIRAFARLGGPEAGRAAAAFFASPDPTPDEDAAYRELCWPLTVRTPYEPGELARFRPPAAGVVEQIRRARDSELLPTLASIRCPTLVVTGADDPFATVEDADEIADAIGPGLTQVHVIPNAGHGVYRDQPEAFLNVIAEFLATLRPGE